MLSVQVSDPAAAALELVESHLSRGAGLSPAQLDVREIEPVEPEEALVRSI